MNAPIRTPKDARPVRSPLRVEAGFVHLKVHSAYSLLEGALPIGTIAKLCQEMSYPAVALTDTNNLFGVLEFSDKLSRAGIQPIAGVSLTIDFEDTEPQRASGPAPSAERVAKRDGMIALYAMSERGYANLMKLVSRAHLQSGEHEGPYITIDQLRASADDLIVLTGGPDGPIDTALRAGQKAVAGARLKTLSKFCGDRLYVELQRHGLEQEAMVEPELLDLAYGLDLPIVATNEAYFASPDDYEAHDVLLCIAEGRYVVEDDRRRVTPDHYFKSAEEMAELFRDLPEALENTVEIAKRCPFRPLGRKPILPRFVSDRKSVV